MYHGIIILDGDYSTRGRQVSLDAVGEYDRYSFRDQDGRDGERMVAWSPRIAFEVVIIKYMRLRTLEVLRWWSGQCTLKCKVKRLSAMDSGGV